MNMMTKTMKKTKVQNYKFILLPHALTTRSSYKFDGDENEMRYNKKAIHSILYAKQ